MLFAMKIILILWNKSSPIQIAYQVWSPEWRCSWSSSDRRCSNYIWVINNFTAYQGAAFIWGVRVTCPHKGAVKCLLYFGEARRTILQWDLNMVETLLFLFRFLASSSIVNIICKTTSETKKNRPLNNSSTPRRCEWNFRRVIFNLILMGDGWGIGV